VWTASARTGAARRSGTSFAAPHVASALALARAGARDEPLDTPLSRLADSARDLGSQGRDPIFGWGLIDARGLCEAAEAVERPVLSSPAVAPVP
jgi:subtilisin family serine protease